MDVTWKAEGNSILYHRRICRDSQCYLPQPLHLPTTHLLVFMDPSCLDMDLYIWNYTICVFPVCFLTRRLWVGDEQVFLSWLTVRSKALQQCWSPWHLYRTSRPLKAGAFTCPAVCKLTPFVPSLSETAWGCFLMGSSSLRSLGFLLGSRIPSGL